MWTHCGCSSDKATLSASSDSAPKRVLSVKQDESTLHLQHVLLAGNKAIARLNRRQLEQDNVSCINLMGTPGAGKTQLLETLLKNHSEIATNMLVLEGDQESVNDAQRIETAGGTALQINTGIGCHLDADMIRAGISALSPPKNSLLFIENVGNLVCPALFDLGESARITMMAVTDGEDKPIKYPHMFSQCDLIIINKTDLLPYVDFDLKRVQHDISHLNPKAKVLLLSAKTGQGMEAFDAWLQGTFKYG